MKRGGNIRKRMGMLLLAGVSAMGMGGCASTQQEVVIIRHDPYEKNVYQTTEVKVGDLDPELTLELIADEMEYIYYDAKSYDLAVEEVYVSAGDKVKEGELLVSFQSEALQQSIDSYEEQIQNNQMLIDHYSNLMKISSDLDYSEDIASLQQDNEIAGLYLEEAKERLDGYQIVAEKSGTITAVDGDLADGKLTTLKRVVTEVCGSGKYTVTTSDDYPFQIGEVYTGSVGIADYRLKLADITDSMTEKGTPLHTLVFEPVSDMSALSDTEKVTLVIEKDQLTDVVYMDVKALYSKNGNYYVYVLDENGFRDVAWVTVGDYVGDYVVITSGLLGGELVTIE